MSDTPSDSMKSRLRRDEPRREPATIDLSATEVRTDSAPESPLGTDKPAPTTPGTTESSEPTPRPTPDEVIPSDDARVSGADAAPSPAEAGADIPAAQPIEPSRRGFGIPSLLAASVIGGLLGGGAAILTETWWRPRVSQVDARLALIEPRLAAAPQNPAAPLESRIASVAAETKALTERVTATPALAQRSAKEIEALKGARPGQPAASENPANASVLADLATRVGAIEKQVQERAQAGATIQERVATIQEHAQAAAAAAQTLERRVADQDQRLAALARQFSERGPEAMAASLRVTLADRLGDALHEGAPVGQILGMLRRLDAKPDTLRPLEAYAQSGPPSTAALAQEFRPLGQRMIAESRPAADWGERVWRMLDKVVTVRAVGDPKATDVASLVARIEDALGRDALGEAAAAWDALPESARRIAQDWGARLKQRAAAETAAQKIYADALSALEASTR